MSDVTEKCLDTFPSWLRSLGDDVSVVLAAAGSEGLPAHVKAQLVAGINYVFKSLDLIPDGIDDIGYLDDAFVLRVSANLIQEDLPESMGADHLAALQQLASQCDLIESFLGGEVYGRLRQYTHEQRRSAVRGRSAEDIAADPEIGREFASEVRTFVEGYDGPSFAREEKNLAKLRAFFEAKLPR
jgi:uncharacterized membrane protein YkvA (DUF1232 family)